MKRDRRGDPFPAELSWKLPDINGMLHRSLPIRILVYYGCQDLRLMIRVRVPHEFAQDLRPPVCLDSVLSVVGG